VEHPNSFLNSQSLL